MKPCSLPRLSAETVNELPDFGSRITIKWPEVFDSDVEDSLLLGGEPDICVLPFGAKVEVGKPGKFSLLPSESALREVLRAYNIDLANLSAYNVYWEEVCALKRRFVECLPTALMTLPHQVGTREVAPDHSDIRNKLALLEEASYNLFKRVSNDPAIRQPSMFPNFVVPYVSTRYHPGTNQGRAGVEKEGRWSRPSIWPILELVGDIDRESATSVILERPNFRPLSLDCSVHSMQSQEAPLLSLPNKVLKNIIRFVLTSQGLSASMLRKVCRFLHQLIGHPSRHLTADALGLCLKFRGLKFKRYKVGSNVPLHTAIPFILAAIQSIPEEDCKDHQKALARAVFVNSCFPDLLYKDCQKGPAAIQVYYPFPMAALRHWEEVVKELDFDLD